MTLIGWILVLVAIGFVALIVMKLVPVYIESMKVSHAVEGVASDPKVGDMTKVQIRDALRKRFDIDDVKRFDGVAFKDYAEIMKRGTSVTIKIDYEAREELFGNVSLLVHFVKMATSK